MLALDAFATELTLATALLRSHQGLEKYQKYTREDVKHKRSMTSEILSQEMEENAQKVLKKSRGSLCLS